MSRIIRKLRKNKDVTKYKIKKAKSTVLKLAIVMINFIFATFAWFTFTKVLNPQVDVHVSAWQVDFKDDAGNLENSIDFDLVGTFYPGMEDFVKEIEIENLGDRAASIGYEIETLKILGQEYQIKQTAEAGDSEYTLYVSETEDTTAGITVVKLLNDTEKFPFEITLTYTTEIGIKNPAKEQQNKGTFEIRLTWPYEITTIPSELPDDIEEGLIDDEILQELNLRKNILDTKWGYKIANFYENLEDDSEEHGIDIALQALAKQII